MIGKELIFDDSLSKLERFYIKVFGIPINGLRIRARRLLPQVTADYKHILDSGCGQGAITFEIARRLPGSVVTGTDTDKELIERNRRISEYSGLHNCHFEKQDITDIPAEEQYDLIISADVLEHIEDDDNALSRYYSALAPGGALLLHVPGYMRRWILFGWKVNFEIEGHFRPGYLLEDIVKKVENSGFIVTDSHYTYGWLETITNNISWIVTGSRMKRKYFYALIFPLLLMVSYPGRNTKPKLGAGVFIKARKNKKTLN